ncbi:unnamed protein product [Eruca vesicaria subsp. sativa]|uniref:Uncharacterized protein n=1 Tax=Eruca vesicaria subsp. sativa TaxID=29727 RepID=A0ABC8K972_ERUVS|nr:unnamed protein product [Eruca vesicaria subsp. sativa]
MDRPNNNKQTAPEKEGHALCHFPPPISLPLSLFLVMVVVSQMIALREFYCKKRRNGGLKIHKTEVNSGKNQDALDSLLHVFQPDLHSSRCLFPRDSVNLPSFQVSSFCHFLSVKRLFPKFGVAICCCCVCFTVRMCFVGNKKGNRTLKEIGTFMMTTCFIANYQSVQVSQAEYFRQLLKPVT